MALLRSDNLDFSEFDGLVAEQILRAWGGERARRIFVNLLRQGATKSQITGRLRELLPSWEMTAMQLDVVIGYLQHDTDGRTNGGGQ